MGWLERKREERLIRKIGKDLSRLPPLRATPQLKLFGTYMQVRNALLAGSDPADVASNEHTSGDTFISAAVDFRAGLRVLFDTSDEVVAFDQFSQQLRNEARALKHSPDQLARQESEMKVVRDYLSRGAKSDGLPPPP